MINTFPNDIPRPEHPNPQWQRKHWVNLNGTWEFEFDFGCSAVARSLWQKERFNQEILVPFCPESPLSGIGCKDFMDGVAYRRFFEINDTHLTGQILLHFGAVDYEAAIYINGQLAGTHRGGYTSFALDITQYVVSGTNSLFVAVKDNVRSRLQPAGKQSPRYESYGCFYTRTTGIWQTVWLEFVPKKYIQNARFYPDPANGGLSVLGTVTGQGSMTVRAFWKGKQVSTKTVCINQSHFNVYLELEEIHLWEAGKGGLYTLTFDFEEDHVESYFGLRSSEFVDKKYMLNGKSVFMRMVLDQGFYPDGIYTAPTEEHFIKDIELSMEAGFNGARLHEKVFEPRFLYHCDRMGYLVWGEYPDWVFDHNLISATEIYMNEWSEAVERDFNHPAIIGWCPFNETWGHFEESESAQFNLHNVNMPNKLIYSIYKLTKRLDPTRPCIDTSGNHRVISEIYDIHDYDQCVETFLTRWNSFTNAIQKNSGHLAADADFFTQIPRRNKDGRAPFFEQPYDNQPIFVSEYGGIRWVDFEKEGWGYGNAPKTAEDFFARYKGLTEALLQNDLICGFCYTQLYDIEQEINGLYHYDRTPKFDIDIIRRINEQTAAIEQE